VEIFCKLLTNVQMHCLKNYEERKWECMDISSFQIFLRLYLSSKNTGESMFTDILSTFLLIREVVLRLSMHIYTSSQLLIQMFQTQMTVSL